MCHQSLLPFHMVFSVFKLRRPADLKEVLKAWSKPLLLCLPPNCSYENEHAWIIIQNNDSFHRHTCCVGCIASTGYDTTSRHSPSVIYVFTKSCFQLRGVTLPLKHIHSSHHTNPLLLRSLHTQMQSECHISSHRLAKWGGYTVSAYKGVEKFAFLWGFPSEDSSQEQMYFNLSLTSSKQGELIII